MLLEGGILRGVHRNIRRDMLDVLYQFQEVVTGSPGYVHSGRARAGDIVVRRTLSDAIALFSYWRPMDLKVLCRCHQVCVPSGGGGAATRVRLLELLKLHTCNEECDQFEYVFKQLAQVREAVAVTAERQSTSSEGAVGAIIADGVLGPAQSVVDDTGHLEVAEESLRRSIIEEWQLLMSNAVLVEPVCAVCGRRTPHHEIKLVDPSTIDFELLRNIVLPEHVLPMSYARAAYGGAILHPKGLTNREGAGHLYVCIECRRDIERKQMPKFALANFLYYGHERLPQDTKIAFEESTQMERMLCSRGRASKISFRFSEIKGHPLYGTDPALSQKCLKGNLAVFPQDSTHLNDILPPSLDEIRDTVCAVFVGKTKPTPKTIEGLRPVLVRKTRVRTIMTFLMAQNPAYRVCDGSSFRGLDEANLNALFGPGTEGVDEGVPCSMEIGHLEFSDAVEGATDSYVPGHDIIPGPTDDEMLMENVGFVDGDNTPRNYQQLRMQAISHCLDGGAFVRSQAGSRLIPDFNNPHLLSWLFPHLDPWGIGGFHEPRRLRPISLEQQLKYLLSVDSSPSFRDDPNFAFIFYNILQKKAVFDSVTFRVPASQRERAISELMRIDRDRLDKLAAAFKRNPDYKPDAPEDISIMRTLSRVQTSTRDLPGTNGYKLAMRNQIRGVINFRGTPTLFVTLNPSDRDHPLVRLYAGHDIDINDLSRHQDLNRWERTAMGARNPAACVKFFHTMMTNFINVILRFRRPGKGLFGKCTAYYGMVEAQGRGALHCHMLIWLEGHLPPQKLRDALMGSESYRSKMFDWLESVIKCELPGTKEVVVEDPGKPEPCPRRHLDSDNSGTPHPGVIPAPSVHAFQDEGMFRDAFDTFVKDVVEVYNWHEHNSTCFKYVPNGTIPKDNMRKDALCRMRIDGHTRATTALEADTGAILQRRLHPRIASYNDVVVFLMRCNMDIKFIGSGEGAKALLYYVTDYITKSSLPAHVGLASLSYGIQRTKDRFPDGSGEHMARSALNTTVNRMIIQMELSHQQALTHVIGGGDCYTDDTFQVLHWGAFDRLFKQHFKESTVREPMAAAGSENVVVESEGDVVMAENNGTGAADGVLEDDGGRDGEIAEDIEGNVVMAENGGTAEADVVLEDDDNGDGEDEEDSDDDEDGCANIEGEDSFVLVLQAGSISAVNQQQDYVYRSIDPDMTSLSLYEFVGTVSKESLKRLNAGSGAGQAQRTKGRFSSVEHTQYATHGLRKRREWVVPVLLGDRTPRSDRQPEEKEAWARMMSILFVPWRTPADLKGIGETWCEAFDRHRAAIPPRLQEIIVNMNVLSECRDARDANRNLRRTEALAFIREGLPAAGMEHSGNTDDLLGDDYELFDRGDVQGVFEYFENDDVLRDMLDAKLGARVRQILDVCYGDSPVRPEATGASARLSQSSNEPAVPGTAEELVPLEGKNRHRVEEDAVPLATQQAVMRELKRNRRPEIAGENLARPAKRRRKNPRAVEVQEEVSRARLEADVSSRVPATVSVHQVADDVVREMGLGGNPEQERAFRLVADHVANPGSKQLMMYIAGVGGTGKTHVVHAVLQLFERLGRRDEILVGAPTGAAALNIGGYTVHSLAMTGSKVTPSLLTTLGMLWGKVKYFIIDEVSMIGARFLALVSRRLQLAKGDRGHPAFNLFGGVNIIFTGDFGQLTPVRQTCLFSYEYVNHPGLKAIANHTRIDNLLGCYIWQQVTTVVELVKNQRQAEDPEYAGLLNRVRVGKARERPDHQSGEKSDVEILYSRICYEVAKESPESLNEFKDAPIIVGTKTLRDLLNARIIAQKARRLGATVTTVYAEDRVDGHVVTGALRQGLWKVSSTTTNNALGSIPLFVGMKVMITENIAFSRRLVNGTVGVVREIVFEVREAVTYPTVVYVHVPGAGKFYEDLEDDIVPVFPERKGFKVKMSVNGVAVSGDKFVSRSQLPIVPAYAYTDYKSQGQSLTYAIVDLQSSKSLQGVYVMLSRVRSLRGLLILRPFNVIRVCDHVRQDVRNEFKRIRADDETTKNKYLHSGRAVPVTDFDIPDEIEY